MTLIVLSMLKIVLGTLMAAYGLAIQKRAYRDKNLFAYIIGAESVLAGTIMICAT